VKLGNVPILVLPWVYPMFLCFPLMHLDDKVFVSHAPWPSSSFVREWEMLQAASVKVQDANVRCRVFEWTIIIMSEKCLKLRVWGFKLWVWGVEFLNDQVWRSKVSELGVESLS
jgi:hypothetical protein